MRDSLKCRVWDKVEKKYLKTVKRDVKTNMHYEWIGWDNTGVYQYDRDVERDIVFVTDISQFVEIEQCTGIEDVEYNLIYEGDIVEDSLGRRGLIKWETRSACFVFESLENNGNYLKEQLDTDTYEYKIVGNINEE